jgi:hypothetical protein
LLADSSDCCRYHVGVVHEASLVSSLKLMRSLSPAASITTVLYLTRSLLTFWGFMGRFRQMAHENKMELTTATVGPLLPEGRGHDRNTQCSRGFNRKQIKQRTANTAPQAGDELHTTDRCTMQVGTAHEASTHTHTHVNALRGWERGLSRARARSWSRMSRPRAKADGGGVKPSRRWRRWSLVIPAHLAHPASLSRLIKMKLP